MDRIKAWLKTHNQTGRYVAIGTVFRYGLSLYRFHPRERFFNGALVTLKSAFGTWKRFSFERSILQRIFHVCWQETLAGKVVKKLPRGDNSYSYNFIQKLRSDEEFENYKSLLSNIRKDPWLSRHCVNLLAVRRDGGYDSEYIEGFNLAHLRDTLFASTAMPPHLRPALAKALTDLLADLQGYHAQHGKLIGDWALHNLVFSPGRESVINVDAEGFYSFNKAAMENNYSWIKGYVGDIIEFLQLLSSHSSDDEKTVAVFKILDEVRRSGESYSGVDFLIGYHSLELNGKMFRGQRECSERLARIPFDFKCKVVVDFGCNSGGMLHALSKEIKKGFGFDFNPKCVNAAQAIKSLNQCANLEFFNFDFDRDELSLIPCLLLHEKVDICFLLSICMWLKRWRMVVHQAAMLAETLLFETNGSVAQQEEQVALLQTYFGHVTLLSKSSEDDPLQSERKLYLCTGRTMAPSLSA